jgi:hypothetical protein
MKSVNSAHSGADQPEGPLRHALHSVASYIDGWFYPEEPRPRIEPGAELSNLPRTDEEGLDPGS